MGRWSTSSLASDLNELFGKTEPNIYKFVDLDRLSIFADNVVPSMLDHYGLLTLGKVLKDKTNSGEDLKWDEALTLRAATVEVADAIVKQARAGNYSEAIKSMNSVKLGYYLWKKGKDQDLVGLKRSCCRTTVFY